ncbi:MAG: acyl-CoA dehydrogenase family protein, partial [Solirubrobacteraceae bacterium]
MNFDYDEDQAALKEFGLELAQRTEDRYWQDVDLEYRFPSEFWQTLAEHGMLGIGLPEEYGGGGKGLLELSIAVEGIAEGGAGMEGGSLFLSGPVFGGCLLDRHGSPEQKQAYLPGLIGGEMWAGAFTEPESGSNITTIRTNATKKDGRYVINGQKVYISQVHNSQRIVVMARTSPYDEQHRTR